MKVSLIVFIVCAMILSVGMPQAAYAKNANVKNPAKAKLSLNTTYNGYDVTGDGKADTIRISSVSLEADEWNVGLKVEINGKKVLYKKDCYYYGIEASLCTLKNGKVYLYLYNPGDDGDAYYCGLYQYKNGKLKCVLNMNKFYGSGKLGYHTNGEVKAVSGNKITVGIYQQNYELGGISVYFDYIYSKGKLVQSSNVTKDFETSVYKGYKQDKIEMRGDRAEMSDFPLYLNTVAGGLDRRDQTIGGFSFVVKIYAVPVIEIIG